MMYQQSTNLWVQIGITSFGKTHNECTTKPNGFTRVQAYIEWITSITGLAIKTTGLPVTRTTRQATTAMTSTTSGFSEFSCRNKADGNYANLSDCATFFMCSNGTAYLFVSQKFFVKVLSF